MTEYNAINFDEVWGNLSAVPGYKPEDVWEIIIGGLIISHTEPVLREVIQDLPKSKKIDPNLQSKLQSLATTYHSTTLNHSKIKEYLIRQNMKGDLKQIAKALVEKLRTFSIGGPLLVRKGGSKRKQRSRTNKRRNRTKRLYKQRRNTKRRNTKRRNTKRRNTKRRNTKRRV